MSSAIASTVFLSLIFLVSQVQATKCLKAETLEALKDDFPVVIRGKILSKSPLKDHPESSEVKIHVVKYIKGDLKKNELKAIETHYKTFLGESYKVGKEYTFPINLKKSKPGYELIVPQKGCPKLPME